MSNKVLVFCLTVLFFLAMGFAASAAEVSRLSTDELSSRLSEDGVVVLDVRSNRDWVSSEVKIVGADRVNPNNVGQWVNNYDKENTIVLYCS